MPEKEKTIKKNVSFSGIGVHTGKAVTVVIKPADSGTGIIFRNGSFLHDILKIGSVIPQPSRHATILASRTWQVSTVEHLMAAIGFLGLDNVIVHIEGNEVPILDGSALSFVCGILSAGLKEQNDVRHYVTPKRKLVFEHDDGRFISIEPNGKKINHEKALLQVDYTADFEHPLLGTQRLRAAVSRKYFIEELAPARTFGFLEQLPFLRKNGLAQGATLGNTVAIGEEEFLNEPRFEDEFVRHKVLDLLGDLALLGKPLLGKVVARKTGHMFNRLVVEHFFKYPEEWEIVE